MNDLILPKKHLKSQDVLNRRGNKIKSMPLIWTKSFFGYKDIYFMLYEMSDSKIKYKFKTL